jgi:WD40 repeat protein/serine/threonine protein kinase
MLKCPSCHKRVLGQDLVSGVCSHCGHKLAGSGGSSMMFPEGSGAPTSDTIDPFTVSGAASASQPEQGGSAQTFISDEISDATQENLRDAARSPLPTEPLLTRTFPSDQEAVPPKAATGSEQTFVSDDFGDDPSATMASHNESPEGENDTGRTVVSHDIPVQDDPGTADRTVADIAMIAADRGMRTYVDDSRDDGSSADGNTAQTFVSDDVPDAMLKTIQSVWGDESEQPDARPNMTMKAREPRQAKPAKQTLVIKTKSLSDTKDFADHIQQGRDPEYELIKVLGEGGMGVVYDARQTSIDRSVALKMIKGAAATDNKQKAKFLAEVVVTGDLDHPNIVPIYDVGSNAQGNLFYSMKKVQGTPWQKIIGQKSLAENLDILMRTADAIGFAHARGIVHRDLKPENIMLGEFGEVLVMDWGLAHPLKGFRKSRSITDLASMGGTPAYMAPEMATGPIDKISPASDIYLLGAILYEILTGGPPHVSKNVMKCLMAAARNEIAPTDKTGELVDIARKAMATAPKDRYQDVKSLQAAIRDYQSHSESVLLSTRAEDDLKDAQRSDDYQHYSRAMFGFQEAHELWTGNKRAAVGIAQAQLAYAESARRKGDFDLGLSLLDGTHPDHALLRRELLDAQQDRIARQKRLVFLKRAAVGLVAAVLVIVSGSAVWIRKEQKKAVAEAARATKAEGVAILEATRATKAEQVALDEKAKAVAAAEEEKKAKILALAAEKEAVRQREATETQRKIAVAERMKAEESQKLEEKAKLAAVEAAKQEEKAKLLALAAEKEAVKQKEAADAQRKIAITERMKAEESQKLEEKAKLAAVEAAKQEEKAKVAAIASEKAAIASEKVAVAEREKAERAKQKEEYEAYISKIGLAASQIDKNAFDAAREVLKTCKPELRNWEWGRLMHLCSQSERSFDAQSPLEAITVDRNEKRFATGGWNGTARVWDRESGVILQTFSHGGEYVNAVAFSPDGRFLATGGNDAEGYIQVWDIAAGKRVQIIHGHEDEVLSLAYSKDGSRLLSSSYDKTARLWDTTTGKEVRTFSGHTWWVWSASFSADEKQVVTAGHDGTAIVWEVASPKRSPAFTGHQGPVFSAAFSPDGKQVVSAGYDRRVLVWSPNDVQPFDFKNLTAGAAAAPTHFRSFEGHTDAVRSVSFSPDGSLLLSSSQDNTVRVWDFAAGQMLKTFRGHGGQVQSALFLADGKRILSASHDRSAREWSISGNAEIRTLQGRVLNGHADAVLAATYSQDQSQIVTASRDRTARTWNTSTGEPGLTLAEGHAYLASTAVFFPNGKRLLTAAVDNTVRIWDVGTGGQLLRLDHSGRSAAATLSHDAKWAATGGDDKSAQLWDAATGKRLKKFEAHLAEVTAVAFSPDDRLLATGDAKGHVKLWNVADGKVVTKLDGHTRRISAIAFLADGSRVLTASGDNTVGQWDVDTGQELPSSILKHPDGILAMQLIPGGTSVVTSCADRKLRIWDTTGAKITQTLGPFEGDIFSLSVSGDGKRLLTANSEERTVRLWELETGREVQSPQPGGQLGPLVDLKLHGGLLWSTAFVPGSDDVLTVGGSDARLWDVKTGRETMSFSPHGAVASAGFSPKGDLIVTGSWDNSAKIWDARTGLVLRKLEGGHTSFINTANFSPDGQFVLTASDDGTAKLWNVQTGLIVKTLAGHTDRVRSAAYSPKGDFIVTTSSDQTARLWNAATGEFIREFKGHRFAVLCGEFTKNGHWLLTGGEDNTARVWNVATGESVRVLSGHTASITSVGFSPDMTRLITGSQDQQAKLWDAQTGKEILTLSRHTEDVTSVAFSPDGRQILTGSRDGTAVIWLSQDWTDKAGVAVRTERLSAAGPVVK